MADSFDPYFKWLAIPPEEQPPNHYRLLGLPLFTDDTEVIQHAADQRMSHVKSFQTGEFSAASQQILNELAGARICLLRPDSKMSYDSALRRDTVPPPAPPRAVADSLSDDTASLFEFADHQENPSAIDRLRRQSDFGLIQIAKAVVVIFTFGGLILVCLAVMSKPSKQTGDGTTQFANDDPNTAATDPPDPFAFVDEPRAASPAGSAVENAQAKQPTAADQDEGEETITKPVAEPQETNEERLIRLSVERDKAIEQGDLGAALLLVKELADLAGGDVLEMQAEIVLADNSQIAMRMRAEAFMTIMDAAIAANRTEFAKTNQDVLLRLTRESGDADLVRRATLAVLKIQAMQPGD